MEGTDKNGQQSAPSVAKNEQFVVNMESGQRKKVPSASEKDVILRAWKVMKLKLF